MQTGQGIQITKRISKLPTTFLAFLLEEARKEAEFIEKDVSRTEFTIEDLKKFSYKDELERYQRNCPILVACVIGSISRSKVISPGVCGNISLTPFYRKVYSFSQTKSDYCHYLKTEMDYFAIIFSLRQGDLKGRSSFCLSVCWSVLRFLIFQKKKEVSRV